MSKLVSENDRGSTGSSEGALTVRELAARLEVPLAWRPWPRARLSERELGALERALADAHRELVGRQALPRSLRDHVQVTQVRPDRSNRTMLAGRRAWGAAVRLAGFAGGLIAFIAGAIAIMAALTTNNARPSPLGGNLSVIVLPFSAGEEEQPAATALAHTVAITLQAQLPQIDPLVLPSVRWYPTVLSQGLAAQGHIAAALASSERADAVMFGDVAEGELATITPYVYI